MSKQAFIDHVLGLLPNWFVREERVKENISAFADIFCRVEEQTDFFHQMTFIDQATEGPPDWLGQHAIDRGLLRQGGETNDALRDRIRGLDDAVNVSSILSSVQDIVDAEGIVGTVGVMELRQDRGFFLVNENQTGTGGQFTDIGDGAFAFEPDVAFEGPLTTNGDVSNNVVTTTSSSSSGNNVTDEPVTGGYLNGFTYDNLSGVAETDATVSWELDRLNQEGYTIDTFNDAYFMDKDKVGGDSFGYRMGNKKPIIIVMLPFGCNQTVSDTVSEYLTKIKGAGTGLIVECRLVA